MTDHKAAASGNDIPSTVELLGNIMRAFADHSLMLETTARAYSANIDGLNYAAHAQYRAMDVTEKHRDALTAEVKVLREISTTLVDMMREAIRILDDTSSSTEQYQIDLDNLKAKWSALDIPSNLRPAQEGVSLTPEM